MTTATSNPLYEIRKLYGAQFGPGQLYKDFCLHLEDENAIIIKSPETFAMIRPCQSQEIGLTGDFKVWFVYALFGSVSCIIPFRSVDPEIGKVAWRRRGQIKVYDLERCISTFNKVSS